MRCSRPGESRPARGERAGAGGARRRGVGAPARGERAAGGIGARGRPAAGERRRRGLRDGADSARRGLLAGRALPGRRASNVSSKGSALTSAAVVVS